MYQLAALLSVGVLKAREDHHDGEENAAPP
jgi:hypothetical protein